MLEPKLESRPWVCKQTLITNPQVLTVMVLDLPFIGQVQPLKGIDLADQDRYEIVGRFGVKSKHTQHPPSVLLREKGTGNLFRIGRAKYVSYVLVYFMKEQGVDEPTKVMHELAEAAYDNMPQLFIKAKIG